IAGRPVHKADLSDRAPTCKDKVARGSNGARELGCQLLGNEDQLRFIKPDSDILAEVAPANHWNARFLEVLRRDRRSKGTCGECASALRTERAKRYSLPLTHGVSPAARGRPVPGGLTRQRR